MHKPHLDVFKDKSNDNKELIIWFISFVTKRLTVLFKL